VNTSKSSASNVARFASTVVLEPPRGPHAAARTAIHARRFVLDRCVDIVLLAARLG
jgi:hypothetical protein